MEAQILLADFAQADASGKVNALGLGWSVTGTPIPNHAVVIMLKVGWDETNAPHHLTLDLLTADGAHAVDMPTPFGPQPLQVEMDFEVGRPPGLVRVSTIDHAAAINVGSLPLQPGRYEWRLRIDDEQRDAWRAPFLVRQARQG